MRSNNYYLNINIKNQRIIDNRINNLNKINDNDFSDEILQIDFKNYYFSNVIARSSKTMLECNNSKIDFKKTGTEG